MLAAVLTLVMPVPLLAAEAPPPATASPQPARPPMLPTDAAALLDGRPVTLADLDILAGPDQIELRQMEYESRRKALDKILQRALVQLDAKARGLEVQQLLAQEVDGKVKLPTSADIEAFKAANPRLDPGGLSEKEMTERIALHLAKEARDRAEKAFIADLLRRYAARYEILLQQPRMDIPTGSAPALGPPEAPVTIAVFADFECEACRTIDGKIRRLMEHHSGRVRVIRFDFPNLKHEHAALAAVAARCAGEQGRYWPFHDALVADPSRLDRAGLVYTADSLGLDADALTACMQGPRVIQAVAADQRLGEQLRIAGTPAVFVNGIPVPEPLTSDWLPRLVDGELERAAK